MVQIIAVAALVLVVIGAVIGPHVVRQTTESLRELREREPIFAPPIEVSINPWLQLQARRMMNATRPHEWRAVSFAYGPCFPENTAQLPNEQYRDAIIEACALLDGIQTRYAADCVTVDGCAIPEQARVEIRGALDVLDEVFLQAGLVEPYTRTEEENR